MSNQSTDFDYFTINFVQLQHHFVELLDFMLTYGNKLANEKEEKKERYLNDFAVQRHDCCRVEVFAASQLSVISKRC